MKVSHKKLAKRLLIMLSLGIFSTMPQVYALPSQGSLNNDKAATFATIDKVMSIKGKGQNNIINWASFNVDRGELVNFADKNNYLNLVRGVDMSRIYGTISGGNMVYLVNPNGILFAEGAKLDNVGSFVASTRNISAINQEAFLNDPSNTAAVLGVDSTVMDNKDYYPDYPAGLKYDTKITVADIQLTNVPKSATKIILDGPGGVILKSTEILNKVDQVLTRKTGGEIGLGAQNGEYNISVVQANKIGLIDGDKVYSYNANLDVFKGYKWVSSIDELGNSSNFNKNLMLINDIKLVEEINTISGARYVLEGLGYSIDNLKMVLATDGSMKHWGGYDEHFLGLYDSFYGEIRNLDLTNIDMNVDSSAQFFRQDSLIGGIAGEFDGQIANVKVSGKIIGENADSRISVGGLVGKLKSGSVIRNSINDVNVMITRNDLSTTQDNYVGGIVGLSTTGGNLFANVINNGNVELIQNYVKTAPNWIYTKMGGITGYSMHEGSKYINVENSGDLTLTIKPGSSQPYGGNELKIGGIVGDGSIMDSIPSHGLVSGRYDLGEFFGEAYNFGKITINKIENFKGYLRGGTIAVGGIVGDGNSKEIESVVTGEKLVSYYVASDIPSVEQSDKIKVNAFGVGKRNDELILSYRQEMLGIYNASEIKGISFTPNNSNQGGNNSGDNGNQGGNNSGDNGNQGGNNSGDNGNQGGNNSGDSGNQGGNNSGDNGNQGGNNSGDSGNQGGNNSGDNGNQGGNNSEDSGNQGGNNSGDNGNQGGNNSGDSGNQGGNNSGDSGNQGGNGNQSGNNNSGGNIPKPDVPSIWGDKDKEKYDAEIAALDAEIAKKIQENNQRINDNKSNPSNIIQTNDDASLTKVEDAVAVETNDFEKQNDSKNANISISEIDLKVEEAEGKLAKLYNEKIGKFEKKVDKLESEKGTGLSALIEVSENKNVTSKEENKAKQAFLEAVEIRKEHTSIDEKDAKGKGWVAQLFAPLSNAMNGLVGETIEVDYQGIKYTVEFADFDGSNGFIQGQGIAKAKVSWKQSGVEHSMTCSLNFNGSDESTASLEKMNKYFKAMESDLIVSAVKDVLNEFLSCTPVDGCIEMAGVLGITKNADKALKKLPSIKKLASVMGTSTDDVISNIMEEFIPGIGDVVNAYSGYAEIKNSADKLRNSIEKNKDIRSSEDEFNANLSLFNNTVSKNK